MNDYIKNDSGQILGFDCPYHGDRVYFSQPYADDTELVCPACGSPICPECGNMGDEDPHTANDAIDYLLASANGTAEAYCGNCGDYGYMYTLRFLRLVGCPLPPDFLAYNTVPKNFSVVSTARVAMLPEARELTDKAVDAFLSGTRGIIKLQHETGEIWAIPDRTEDGWILSIVYPEER